MRGNLFAGVAQAEPVHEVPLALRCKEIKMSDIIIIAIRITRKIQLFGTRVQKHVLKCIPNWRLYPKSSTNNYLPTRD
jgi:hypothetical protein